MRRKQRIESGRLAQQPPRARSAGPEREPRKRTAGRLASRLGHW